MSALKIDHLRENIAPHILRILETMRDAGYESYLVGGAVRDMLMGRHPKDYDLSTAATPEELKELFGRRRARIIGRRFKIAHLYQGKEIIEVSTFRKAPRQTADPEGGDPAELLIRRDNEYGTSVEDAWRRDFTVNAIFYDPLDDRLVDHTRMGLDDLAAGRVRTIGDPALRFSEDPVRMLRALKLVGQYGFRIVPETEEALRERLELVDLCPKSRLLLEMEKILRNPYSGWILAAFREFGFLRHFLPNLDAAWETDIGRRSRELLIEHNKRMREGDSPDFISGGVAAMVLPFVDVHPNTGAERHCDWYYYTGIEKDIRDIVYRVLFPHCLPKFVIGAAVSALMLQPRLKNRSQAMKISRHPCFRAARELMIAQNDIWWKIDGLDTFWRGDFSAAAVSEKPRRRRRGGRRRSRRDAPNVSDIGEGESGGGDPGPCPN